MKKGFYLILFFFLTQSAFAQGLENTDETVFKVGEELKYRLRYGFLTAAEAILKVEQTDIKFNDRSVFHLIAQGKTAGSFDFFYKVRNRYDSYIDRTELLPYLYTENVREGNYRRNDKVRFFRDQMKITSRKGTFTGKPQTFDLVSAYYFARSLDMSEVKAGKKLTMHYFLDDGVTDLQIQYLGKERVKTSLGYFDCLKFSPSIQPGRVFRKDSKLYLWITDDGNRIPVKAQVELIVGSVTLELTGASNLKYPLTVTKKGK
jgi:hypothetical protein